MLHAFIVNELFKCILRKEQLEREKIEKDPSYKESDQPWYEWETKHNEEISKNKSEAAKASWAKRREGRV